MKEAINLLLTSNQIQVSDLQQAVDEIKAAESNVTTDHLKILQGLLQTPDDLGTPQEKEWVNNALEFAMQAIARASKLPRWISVEEQLPPFELKVLLLQNWADEDYIHLGHLKKSESTKEGTVSTWTEGTTGREFVSYSNNFSGKKDTGRDITDWMFIPDPASY